MTDKKDRESQTDNLLRYVFKDDLPSVVERRMKDRIIRFQEKVDGDDQVSDRTSYSHRKPFLRVRWAFGREVLAFSSLIMIVVGAFLHVSGHRSAVAETLSFLNASVSVADRVQNAASMECRIHVPTEVETSQSYTIYWFSPEQSRVDVRQGETLIKSLLISGSSIILADHIHNTSQKYQGLEQLKDPLFRPALEFISPTALATAIYEQWKPQYYREVDEGQKGTFVYLNNGDSTTLEMTVDMDTNLPLTIKKFSAHPTGDNDIYGLTLEAQFIWNEPVSFKKIRDKDELGRE